MSEEYVVADTQGRFAQAMRDGRRVNDAAWTSGRIVLSNRRLVLAGNDGKRTVPLGAVEGIGGRHDASQSLAQVAGYVSLQFEDEVLLVAARDHDAFERDVYRALLDKRMLLVRHPAVEGGVVQDTEWEKGRLQVGEDALNLALQGGTFVSLDLADIGTLDAAERTVRGEKRLVVEAEHTEGETSVQTHIAGTDRQCALLRSLLGEGERRSAGNLDLCDPEREVLMALYSGVSPFEIPAFLDMDVDAVEAIFERLVDLEVVEEVRVRREVALLPRGRNAASRAMSER